MPSAERFYSVLRWQENAIRRIIDVDPELLQNRSRFFSLFGGPGHNVVGCRPLWLYLTSLDEIRPELLRTRIVNDYTQVPHRVGVELLDVEIIDDCPIVEYRYMLYSRRAGRPGQQQENRPLSGIGPSTQRLLSPDRSNPVESCATGGRDSSD